jgi:hypothetical protein
VHPIWKIKHSPPRARDCIYDSILPTLYLATYFTSTIPGKIPGKIHFGKIPKVFLAALWNTPFVTVLTRWQHLQLIRLPFTAQKKILLLKYEWLII